MDENTFSSAILKFSARFLNELDKIKSVISSPLSAEFVLAVLALGATGPSHNEILTQLGLSDEDVVRTSFPSLITQLKSIKGVTLTVANKLYIGELDLQAKVKDDALQLFDTNIEQVNFGNAACVAKLINDWVENSTNKKIKNIITESQITEDLEMILINAIYFKGTWRTQFKPRLTVEEPFYVNTDRIILVPMMKYSDRECFKHGKSVELDAEILELPYEGEDSKMVIVLPSSLDGLNDVVKKLAEGYDLLAELDKLHTKNINISLPKFKIETEINLNVILKKLGITSIFDKGLDKMLECGKSIRVTEALQKAFIEVNEQGTEAAAVTKKKLMLHRGPRHFNANHPFLYTLVGPRRTVLFIGLYRGDLAAPTTDRGLFDSFEPEIISVEEIV